MKTNYMILYKDMEVFCKVPGVFAPKIPRGVFVSIVSPLKHEAVEKKKEQVGSNQRGFRRFEQSQSLPSGKLTKLWQITIFNGKIHYKWPCSIATLNYQRVPQEAKNV